MNRWTKKFIFWSKKLCSTQIFSVAHKKMSRRTKKFVFDQKKNDVRLKFLVLHTKKWVVGWKNSFFEQKNYIWLKFLVFHTKKWVIRRKNLVFGYIFWNFGPLSTPEPEKWGVTPQKVGSGPQKWVPNPKNGGFWPQKRGVPPKNGGYPPKWGVETKWRFLGVEFHGFFLKIWSLKTMVFCRVRSKLCSGLRGTPRKLDPFLPNFDQKMGVF